MTSQLEEQLREAYAQLPEARADRSEVLARSYRGAAGLRRRRMLSVCAGTTAAALVLGAAVVVGGNLGTSPRQTTLLPAGDGTSTAARTGTPRASTSSARSSVTGSATASKSAPATQSTETGLPQEGTDKPLAGLSGKLLPHGSQLPAGMKYHGMNTQDYNRTWTTSKEDGYANGVPLMVMIGADQSLDGPSTAQIIAAYGIVSSVYDAFDTPGLADTSPKYRSVDTQIVRFRSPADANGALAKAQRKEGGLYWVMTDLTRPNVPWSGVPGVTGDHGVFYLSKDIPGPSYVVYQIVGPYIVSADASEKEHAEQAVVNMVKNLKTAGLVR